MDKSSDELLDVVTHPAKPGLYVSLLGTRRPALPKKSLSPIGVGIRTPTCILLEYGTVNVVVLGRVPSGEHRSFFVASFPGYLN